MTNCPRCGKENPAEIHTCTPPRALVLAEALVLADELEMWTLGEPAAEELRRLHAELSKVKQITLRDEALLQQALAALDPPEHLRFGGTGRLKAAAIAAIKERLG